jgi:redox-sensitive bicupin YhaK (pirin superfamily)
MISIRRSDDRGHFNFGWLNTYHTFSFGDYHDPDHMGFRSLRVINEDVVSPSSGFPFHPHRDMEIITYIVSGELEHQDSLGTGSVIRRGDVQMMSAGTGIRHSEFNPSENHPVHLLQIWIIPAQQGRQPRYDQRKFSIDENKNRLHLIVSPDGETDSMAIGQDVTLCAGVIESGNRVVHSLLPGRAGWVQIIKGESHVNGERLFAGDGAAIFDENDILIEVISETELLLFDMA